MSKKKCYAEDVDGSGSGKTSLDFYVFRSWKAIKSSLEVSDVIL